jgi:hypothetical protein
MILSAPLGIRRVTTSRSIKLESETPSDYEWKLVRDSIDRIYIALWQAADDVVYSDKELQSFVIRE